MQIFLPIGQEVSLLVCKDVELYGKARDAGMAGSHDQWFQEFRVRAAGRDVVTIAALNATQRAVATKDTNLTTVAVAIDGARVNSPSAVVTSTGALVTVSQDTSRRIAAGYVETVSVAMDAQDVEESTAFEIQSATPSKFESATLQMLHTHLDLRFLSLNTAACTAGVLAEVWGAVPMSTQTAAMMQQPAQH